MLAQTNNLKRPLSSLGLVVSIYHHGTAAFPSFMYREWQTKKRKRCRGPNHGHGKGNNGMKVRQGNRKVHRSWEGGQTPINKASPMFRWHKPDHNAPLQWLDINKLKEYLDLNQFNTSKVITMRELYQAKCIPTIHNGLALINNTNLENIGGHKIHIVVTFVTPSAKQAIENSGGIVRVKYYDHRKLHKLLNPESEEIERDMRISNLDSIPRPRWRHMFPDYPQLHVRPELQYLKKYQMHPKLLPNNISDEKELQEQKEKLLINNNRNPEPLLLRHTNLKNKLFKWAKPN